MREESNQQVFEIGGEERKSLTQRALRKSAEFTEKRLLDWGGGEMKKPLGHRGRAALSSMGCIYAGAAWIAKQLPIGHFLGHIQKQFAIFLIGFAQQAA